MKYKSIMCLALTSFCVLLCSGCGKNENNAGYNICNTYKTTEMVLRNNVSAAGTVEGSEAISITSSFNTKVTMLNVGVGSTVKAGDILCEFDRTEFQRQYDLLSLEIENEAQKKQYEHDVHLRDLTYAENQKEILLRIAQREIDEADAKKEAAHKRVDELGGKQAELYNRMEELDRQISEREDIAALVILRESAEKEYNTVSTELQQLSSSLIEYDNSAADARDNYDRIASDCDHAIQAANDALNADSFVIDSEKKLKLEELRKKLDECTIYAPKDGIITSLSVKEGSIPMNESIMTIADNSSFIVNATVYETDILKIVEGQKCEISILANSEKNYKGEIVSVSKIRDEKLSDSSAYSVRISIDDADDSVIIGMSTQVNIIAEMREKTIAVPYEAICSDETGKEYVFVGKKNSDNTYTVSKRNVTTGMESSYLTEISGDVAADEYIMFPAADLTDGDVVKVKDVYSSDDFNE